MCKNPCHCRASVEQSIDDLGTLYTGLLILAKTQIYLRLGPHPLIVTQGVMVIILGPLHIPSIPLLVGGGSTQDIPHQPCCLHLRRFAVRLHPSTLHRLHCPAGMALHHWLRPGLVRNPEQIQDLGFRVLGGTSLGVPIIRIIVVWSLY